ncbi:MAG TPA: CHASE2 domain-containing protein [Trichocoleus sp.]|jgi:CHASE2 domain-containing sensor protein
MLGLLLRERYKLIAVLGAGGFGQTYLAEDLQQPEQPRCVVKHFKPIKTDAHYLEVARRLFKTEAATLEKLGEHPQIPTFLEFFEQDHEFYLVQEFIAGTPLSQELSPSHRWTETQAIDFLRNGLDILEFVHHHHVIHRDIKPANLIRRPDGQFVLIDFGAVKEIHSQLSTEPGHSTLTISIGTPGYTAMEQLAGKPRYCSDLYSLGVTTIQALTGLQPAQFLTDSSTGEFVWQNQAEITPRLQAILTRLVRYHFSQRYQSATEALQALDRLSDSLSDTTTLPSALLRSEPLDFETDQTNTFDHRGMAPRPVRSKQPKAWRTIALTTLAVTGLLGGARSLGWLQAPELSAYDQIVRLRPDRGTDPRLLLVEITESDLQALRRSTPSDQDVAQVIKTLSQYQPRVIGLDLHRELPQEPGHANLMQQLRAAGVITIMTFAENGTIGTPAPSTLPSEQIGFSDFPIDPDGVVRRGLLFGSSQGTTYTSFALQIALKYLATEQIQPQNSPVSPGNMQLGAALFLPLEQTSGGYHSEDAGKGYQTLLDYRSPNSPAQTIAFTAVLQGKIKPEWVKDKVVLIGTTAPSGKDLFFTPFSGGTQTEHKMPGVAVHAQIVSQILQASIDQQPLFHFIPEWTELLWIGTWAAIGSGFVWVVYRRPLRLGLGTIVLIGTIAGTTFVAFSFHLWIPSVAPTIAFFLAGVSVIVARSSVSLTGGLEPPKPVTSAPLTQTKR